MSCQGRIVANHRIHDCYDRDAMRDALRLPDSKVVSTRAGASRIPEFQETESMFTSHDGWTIGLR